LPAGLLWKLRIGPPPESKGGPSRESQLQSPPATLPGSAILDALSRWRAEIANGAGLPPFRILSDEVLSELARCRPATHEQLLAVKGIGPAKVERFGHALLEIVAEADVHVEGHDERKEDHSAESASGSSLPADEPRWWTIAAKQSPARFPASDHGHAASEHVPRPSHYWTQRLLAAGFTVDECAAIRGLTREVVLEHARLAERHAD
jgi:ATP-dependent DNA helicase RecQ